MKFTEKQKDQRKKLHTDVTENWTHHKGKFEWLKALNSFDVTRMEAMTAMCYQCSGGWEGGTWDCKSVTCPMYFYQPYRETKETKKMSIEDKAALVERLNRHKKK